MNAIEMVQDECMRHDVVLSEEDAGFVLWNATGFPSFYTGDREVYFRRQVRHWLANRLVGSCECEALPRETDEEHLDVDEGLHHPRCPRRVEVE